MEDRSFRQRCLGPAIATLKHFDPLTTPVAAMAATLTFGTGKPVGPPRYFECGLALLLCSVMVKELAKAHAWLKLNSVHLHGNPPYVRCHETYHYVATEYVATGISGRITLIRNLNDAGVMTVLIPSKMGTELIVCREHKARLVDYVQPICR